MRTCYLSALALLALLGGCTAGDEPEQAAAGKEDVAAGEVGPATMPRTASDAGARVFFVSPADGETVSSPVTVVFGIEGMTVVPAGDDTPNSGHHHLLIDTDLPDLGLPIPKDAHHVHFGDGSAETEIDLEPGEHTLQMLLGDYLHVPHDPPVVSERITIQVE